MIDAALPPHHPVNVLLGAAGGALSSDDAIAAANVLANYADEYGLVFEARSRAASRKKGRDITGGDIILFLGESHRIVHFATHPREEGWRIAYDRRGWGITLLPDSEYAIA
jgi:hypothetical protein